jgi:hypothetical protein
VPIIPSVQEADVRSISIQVQPSQNVNETPSQPRKLCMVAHLSSQIHRDVNRMIVQNGQAKKMRLERKKERKKGGRKDGNRGT